MLKILFLGSNLQAYRCFKYLVENFTNVEIVALVPHFGHVTNREDQNIVEFAKQKNIKVLKHEDISNLKFDLGISLLYDKIIDAETLKIPERGFVNFHLGPLPRFKGSNSVLYAILLARKDDHWKFGVTLHYIEPKLDSGPIIDMIEMPIFEDDTSFSLYNRAYDKVFDLFVSNIEKIISSKEPLPSKPQSGKSYLFKKGQVDHFIDIKSSPIEIYDKVRALSFPGRPRAYTLIGNKKIYLTLEEK